jgi:hypothetical protein
MSFHDPSRPAPAAGGDPPAVPPGDAQAVVVRLAAQERLLGEILARLDAQDRLLARIAARLEVAADGSPRTAADDVDAADGDDVPRPFPYGASLP